MSSKIIIPVNLIRELINVYTSCYQTRLYEETERKKIEAQLIFALENIRSNKEIVIAKLKENHNVRRELISVARDIIEIGNKNNNINLITTASELLHDIITSLNNDTNIIISECKLRQELIGIRN